MASIYPHCGALLNISDILVECELYNEGHHTCGTHVTLHDASRDDPCCNISNILAFITSIGM